MKLYLSGPMTGIQKNNADYFAAVAKTLRYAGHEVFNPAEKGNTLQRPFWPYSSDTEWYEKKMDVRESRLSEPERRIWLRDDIFALSLCDAIILLPDWESSRGARAEKAWAESVNMRHFIWENFSDQCELGVSIFSAHIILQRTQLATEGPSQ